MCFLRGESACWYQPPGSQYDMQSKPTYHMLCFSTNILWAISHFLIYIFYTLSRYTIRCKTVDERGKIVLDFELEVCEIPRLELIGKEFFEKLVYCDTIPIKSLFRIIVTIAYVGMMLLKNFIPQTFFSSHVTGFRGQKPC